MPPTHRFRTEICQHGQACTRPVCFFAHSVSELRPLPPGLPPAELCWGTGASQRIAAQRFTATRVGVMLNGGGWAAAPAGAVPGPALAFGLPPVMGVGMVYPGGGTVGAPTPSLRDATRSAAMASFMVQPGSIYAQQGTMMQGAMPGGGGGGGGRQGVSTAFSGPTDAIFWHVPPGAGSTSVAPRPDHGIAAGSLLLGGAVGQHAMQLGAYDATSSNMPLQHLPVSTAATQQQVLLPQHQQAAAFAALQEQGQPLQVTQFTEPPGMLKQDPLI